MAKSKVKKRFYRGKLPTVVWDRDNDKRLCSLEKGHYTTDDPRTIKILQEIGYIEIPLDATRPPDIIDPIQPASTPDIKPLPNGVTEKGAAMMQELAGEKKESEDHDGPAVPAPKKKSDSTTSKPAISNSKPKKSSSSAPKRTIKRRTK